MYVYYDKGIQSETTKAAVGDIQYHYVDLIGSMDLYFA